jgi:hypothetical protein
MLDNSAWHVESRAPYKLGSLAIKMPVAKGQARIVHLPRGQDRRNVLSSPNFTGVLAEF